MGKKFDCWVANTTYNMEGIPLNATVYYDKTSRFNLKVMFNNQTVNIPNSPITININGQGEITNTNLPLIGLA